MIHSHIDKKYLWFAADDSWLFYKNFLSPEMNDSVLYINTIIVQFLYIKSSFSIPFDFQILYIDNTSSKQFLLSPLSLRHY